MDKLEYRMYGLVPYNISPIQQGIQYGHALQEYNNMFFEELFADKWKGKKKSDDFHKFQKWANVDKTFIILNGGTTNNQHDLSTGEPIGTLNQHLLELIRNGVKFATFTEPDLNDALTAIVFLVDERVFNKEKYPDKELAFPNEYKSWVESIGGQKNIFLREFLSQFKLA